MELIVMMFASAILLAFSAYALASPILLILMYVAQWHIFGMAGAEEWACLVPFYNVWTMLKMTGKERHCKKYVTGIILAVIGTVVALITAFCLFAAAGAANSGVDSSAYAIGMFIGLPACMILMVVSSIMLLISNIAAIHGVCQKTGKGTGFLIGLLFLPQIFWLILGFSKNTIWQNSQYTAFQNFNDQQNGGQDYTMPPTGGVL